MSQDYSKVKPLVKSWTPLIGDMFFHPWMQSFAKELQVTRELPFDEVHGDEDYFKIFREIELDSVKFVYIKDVPDSPEQQLREIELDLFEGLNLNLMIQEDFSWLHDQGVMVLPRKFTWGTPEALHDKWKYFTDEVLKRLMLKQFIGVCTNDQDVLKLIDKTNSAVFSCGQGPGCWNNIDSFIQEYLGEKIEWDPWKCGEKYRH